MKKLLSLLLVLVFATSLIWGGSPTKKDPKPKVEKAEKVDTAKGYAVSGDTVTFMFNPKDYPEGFDEIEQVTVAGEFNGWDAGAKDWQAELKSDGIWYFKSTTEVVPNGTKFKFVANTVDWQQPDPEKVAEEYLTDDGYGGFNLVVIY